MNSLDDFSLGSEKYKRESFDCVSAILADMDHESQVYHPTVPAMEDQFSALLPAYADTADILHDGLERCAQVLDRSIDFQQRVNRLHLYGGWTGLGWLTTHLDAEADFVAPHVDGLLTRALVDWPPRFGYDLIGGLLGVGVYFVERLPAEQAKRGLLLVLEALEQTTVKTTNGTTWFTAPEFLPAWQRRLAPKGYYNLGVAHGVPGVCWLLGKLCTADVGGDRAASLLYTSLRWIRSHQQNPAHPSLPSWATLASESEPELHSRMAWCYGPLGVSAVALNAAKTIWDKESIEWARALALACARVPLEEAQIRDAGLCHGAAGNAHIFLRLYRNEGHAMFRQAARDWLKATLAYRRPGEGIGGYRMWGDVDGRQEWVDDASFLSGSAGVGLALLAAVTTVEPRWDRLLLLS